jgi:uncharacterized phage protein gp47/JayE
VGFQRPALAELIERIEQDIVSRLGIGTPPRMALARILARAEAGVAHGLHGYIDNKEKNFLPDTGDDASVLRWASLYGVVRISPVSAAGVVQATGTNGSVIPAGRVLQRADGLQYTVDADATIASGIANINVTSVTQGSASNLAAGETVSPLSPIPGVLSTMTVQSGGLSGGDDLETIDGLRVRVLDRMRSPPKGGTASDYVEWAKAAHPAVTRAWATGQEMSDNSVTVRVVTDDEPGGIIPDSEVIDAVADYISLRRPVTAEVYVVAPTAVAMPMTIAINPNTQAVRDAITAELQDLIKREAEPGGTILLSRLREAVSNATGEQDSVISVPSANVTRTTGQITTLGTITWSTL